MLRNEISSASWKFGLIFIIALVALTQLPTPYEEIVRSAKIEQRFEARQIERMQEREGVSEREARQSYGYPPDPVDWAMDELSGAYTIYGAVAMVALGGLLGISLVSSEVGSGTILAILSRPVSRRRIFLTKYLTSATFLLVAAVLGVVGIFVVSYLRGYPFDEVTWGGVVLAVFLMWLASLFVLGIALIVSILTRNVMQSLLVTAAVVFAILALPTTGADFLFSILFDYETDTRQLDTSYWIASGLTMNNYWPDSTYFWSDSSEYIPSAFLAANSTFFGNSRWGDVGVTLAAAIIPASVAFWLFERKKF